MRNEFVVSRKRGALFMTLNSEAMARSRCLIARGIFDKVAE